MIGTAATTAWKNGRFDARSGPEKLLFGRMYEDVEIELEAFQSAGRIFCIASAGCTAMALSARHEVVAVDLNSVQIAYLEQRLAGAATERGSAERLLVFLRQLAPLAGWTGTRLREFLALCLPNEQREYWRVNLNTRRFRAALDLLLARPILRAGYGSDLIASLPANFGAVLRERMERCFSRHSNCTNPYAHLLLAGSPPPDPTMVCTERISLAVADAAEFLESASAGSFSGFSLSNIFDGANRAYVQRLISAVQRAATPDAVAVVRSFRQPRGPLSNNRAAEDRSMLWGIVGVWSVDYFSLGVKQAFV